MKTAMMVWMKTKRLQPLKRKIHFAEYAVDGNACVVGKPSVWTYKIGANQVVIRPPELDRTIVVKASDILGFVPKDEELARITPAMVRNYIRSLQA